MSIEFPSPGPASPPRLHWRARRRIGFLYYWLREVTRNQLEGFSGVNLTTPVVAPVEVRLEAPLRAAVSAEADGWRRLRFCKAPGCDASAPRIRVDVSHPDSTLPDGDELLAALLGVPGQAKLLAQALDSSTSSPTFSPEVAAALTEALGPVRAEPDFAGLRRRLEPFLGLRDRIYEAALPALARKCSAELACGYQSADGDTPLLECCFAPTPRGERLYQEALQGMLASLDEAPTEDYRPPAGPLIHVLRRQANLELHLPLLDKRSWRNRTVLLPSIRPEAGEDGRMAAGGGRSSPADSQNQQQTLLTLAGAIANQRNPGSGAFSLAFSDRRRLHRAQLPYSLAPLLDAYGFEHRLEELLPRNGTRWEEVDVSLTLSVPCRAAVAWLHTPAERSVAYYEGLSQVSVTVQSSLRRWIPYLYFSDLDRLEDLETVYSLLAYQASQPFRRKARADFTYDPMNPASLHSALRSAAPGLRDLLRATRRVLVEAGRERQAEAFAAKREPAIFRSVRRAPQHFRRLLAADAACMRQFSKLANRGRQIRQQQETSPEEAARHLLRFSGEIAKNFRLGLRRVCGGESFPALGSLLLLEATSTISGAWDQQVPVEAVLRLSDASGATSGEVVVVNRARRSAASRLV